MKNVMWEMSRRLVIEQRYLALKDSQKFQQRMGASTMQGERYIQRLIMTTYLFTSAMMGLFSAFLVNSDTGVTSIVDHMQTISFILYSYVFLFSLYSVVMFINIIRNYKLFEPLRVLPTNLGHFILPLSWFVYNGSSSLYVIIPIIVEYTLFTGNLSAIPFGIILAVIVMAMGYLSGVLIVSFLSSRNANAKRGKLGAFSNLTRLVGVIGIFVLFEIALQAPNMLPQFPPITTHLYLMFVPLINVSYVAYPSFLNTNMLIIATLSTALYAALFLYLFIRFNKRIFLRISEQDLMSQATLHHSESRVVVKGFYRNSFSKDIRNIFRKPQNATMVLIPIIFVTPTLFQLFFYSSSVSFGTISVYLSLLSIVIVSSAFYSIVLIISEGNGISVLQSLPIKLRDIIYSKNYVGAIIFTIIVTPISILFILKESTSVLEMVLLPANLIVAYVYTSLYNLRRLLRKLPRGSTTVNFYSFGGNLALMVLFGITFLFTAVPTLIATVITYEVTFSPFSHPVSFYLSALALNLGALYITMNLVNRSV